MLVGLGAQSGCNKQHALLLTVSATSLVENFDIQVKNLASGEIVLKRLGEQVDVKNPNRDISVPGQELKIAIEFADEGNYLVYLQGRTGVGDKNVQFFLRDYQIDGVREEGAKLVPLVADFDGDGIPACGTTELDCAKIACRWLDCNDTDRLIGPFAAEVCGDGIDNDCSAACGAKAGAGDAQCVDKDNDGVPTGRDCDDNDPCRSPIIVEAKNFCGKCGGVDQNQFPALPKACLDKMQREGRTLTPPFCGDQIDQDCNGQDVACVVDEDCDCYSPPQDCDESNDKINPSAVEICDGLDNNCNGLTDEGCVPCDVDGDGHALPNNADPSCTVPKDDTDDFDSGIFPGAMSSNNGSEGASLLGALREYCSYADAKNSTTAAKIRHRDIDHDSDGKAAKDDGCPTEACDKDGDGFMNSTCNPPASLLDCDDNDSHTFPGAPDYCGDGKAQNCVSDTACGCDKDGDHFCPPADCNDNAADAVAALIHPWAKELCDRVDNDCDGLIDEGNPDAQGNLIPTTRKTCSDDSQGECSPSCAATDPNCSNGHLLSGVCACSPLKPVSTIDAANRVACAGENLSAATSLRCFGAIQPKPELCDTLDQDCDGRNDAPDGKNLADKGKTCGTSVGNCTAGTVVGCDLTKTVANATLVKQVLAAQNIEFNEHWLCSNETQLPVPEVCDGKDDDCNNVRPDNELDQDNDHFLACSGCTIGSGRFDLASTYTGCADCRDNAADVFPGALEKCNNIDDNCANGVTDDGKGECQGQLSCCSSQQQCRALATDKFNCGVCGNVCPAATTDQCVAGSCVCGNTGAPCGPGLNCEGGQCRCISGATSRCNGCCDNNVCLTVGAAQSVAKCGVLGAACASCDDSKDCTNDSCTAGVCGHTNKASRTVCDNSSGTCLGDACCHGCVSGTTCLTGDQVANCGKNGQNCAACNDNVFCTQDLCVAGACNYPPVTNGTSCSDGNICTHTDICTNGACGGTSYSCTPNQCQSSSTCDGNGGCTVVNKPAGATCNDAAACTNNDKCNTGACAGTAYTCTPNQCQTSSTCNGTDCTIVNKPAGTGCDDGNISTRNDQCNGGACAGTAYSCTPTECQSSSTPNGTDCTIVNKSDGSACTNGLCYGGNCCTGCFNGTSCVSDGATNPAACGINGANCATCPTACTAGTCS